MMDLHASSGTRHPTCWRQRRRPELWTIYVQGAGAVCGQDRRAGRHQSATGSGRGGAAQVSAPHLLRPPLRQGPQRHPGGALLHPPLFWLHLHLCIAVAGLTVESDTFLSTCCCRPLWKCWQVRRPGLHDFELLASRSLAMTSRRAVTPCRRPSEAAGAQVLLANEQLGKDVSLSRLAEKTGRFSGSDLRALCTAAAMRPVRELLEASGKSARVSRALLSLFHWMVPERSARCSRAVSRFPERRLVDSQSSTRGVLLLCGCCNAYAVMSASLTAVLLGVLVA